MRVNAFSVSVNRAYNGLIAFSRMCYSFIMMKLMKAQSILEYFLLLALISVVVIAGFNRNITYNGEERSFNDIFREKLLDMRDRMGNEITAEHGAGVHD